MKQFRYVIKEKIGLHARPAGLFVKEASKAASSVTVEYLGNRADAKSILKVMELGVKSGGEILVTVEGVDEISTAQSLEEFCKKNL